MTIIIPSSVAFIPSLQRFNMATFANGQRSLRCLKKKFLPNIPEFSLRLTSFMDNLGEFAFPNRVSCG